jgi:hypothetical protein
MILASGAGLLSEIDELGLDIQSDALVEVRSFRMAVSDYPTLTTLYTWTPPASFTGDFVVSFYANVCYLKTASTYVRGGRFFFCVGKRISGTLTACTTPGQFVDSYCPQSTGSMPITLVVSGGSFLVRLAAASGASTPQITGGIIEILAFKV